MSNATFAFGRFNPPTEEGHGKLVSAVQRHAEETGGRHYIFPTKSQDKKKNPMSHEDKVGAMKKLFPTANIVSHKDVNTVIGAMKHLESKGHTHVTMVAGSDRVGEFQKLLNSYREKEFPKIKKVNVVSAGHRDPDAEGAEGMSASKLRELVAAGKKKEFVSHYSDPKIGAHIHDKVKEGMQMKESVSPVGIFLLGGPGSGKDYVLKNIFSRFDLTEVQADRILSGSAHIIENNQNIVINGVADFDKIEMIKNILEGYEFDYVHVSVTNKVSRIRNSMRNDPLVENKRIEKFLKAEKLSENYNCFKFNNSINLHESSDMEQIIFASQIEQLLERLVTFGLEIKESVPKDKESGLPKKYVSGLTPAEIAAKKKQIERNANLSDKDPEAYKDMPGDKRIREKGIPQSKHTKKYHDMYGEASSPAQQAAIAINMKKRGVKPKNEEAELDEAASDNSLSAKAKKSGISIGTLRKVYNRGMAAWNSGHRPGTTPQQWAMARVNSYITHGKTYHTADKDLHEETDIDSLFEMQLVGTDSYRDHALSTTPGQSIEEPLADKNSCVCGGSGACECEDTPAPGRTFKDLRKEAKDRTVDLQPELSKADVKKKRLVAAPRGLDSTMQGLPVSSRFSAFESKDPALKEAIQYHLDNNISITENVFRPGSDMFFQLISETKRLYTEGKYTPVDEYEQDLLKSDIGEIAEYEGQPVVLDFPIEETIEEACWTGYVQKGMKKKGDKMVPNCVNEEDETSGQGIGKPFRSNGGGAVYVKNAKGNVIKVNFSQSGMKKRINEPGRVRSFVARHHCLTNKDRTSAAYWACRWPRYFSNTGQQWW